MTDRSPDHSPDRDGRLRWGILGTGNIARQFSAGVNASGLGRLAAVGSRHEEAARAFAAAFAIPVAHGGYSQLLADPAVEAVYIALPNSLHHPWTIAALRAGKHVLCEKPLAVSAAEAEEMFDEAEKAGRVLAEAFMYRGQPLTRAVIEAVRGGAIGALRLIRSSFCFRTHKVAGNVRFDADLAGGGLMDVGCYCVHFSRLFAGLALSGREEPAEPAVVQAVARFHERGVDELLAGTLLFAGEGHAGSGAGGAGAGLVIASFTCGMTVHADNTAELCGSEGYIEIPVPWKPPARGATYVVARSTPPRQDGEAGATPPATPPRETFTVDAGMDLYAVEADDFAAAVREGRPPRVGRRDAVGNLRVLDAIGRQIGGRKGKPETRSRKPGSRKPGSPGGAEEFSPGHQPGERQGRGA